MSRLLVLGPLLGLLVACPCPSPAPLAPMTDVELRDACAVSIGLCEASGEDGPCDAAEACVRLRLAAERCRIDLRECRALAEVDLGEQVTLRARAEQEAERLRWERWVWGAVGLVLGAGVTVGVVLGR